MNRVLSVLIVFMFAGCSYSNSSGDQSAPPTRHLSSIPTSAEVFFPDRGRKLSTPCELPLDYDEDEPLIVTKYMYRQWEGVLGDLPRTGDMSYEVRLEPLMQRR